MGNLKSDEITWEVFHTGSYFTEIVSLGEYTDKVLV